MFKTSAVERRWNICPSWSPVERRQLYSIVGKRTGTAVRRLTVELRLQTTGCLHWRSMTVLLRLDAVFEIPSHDWWRSSHDCLRFCTFSHASRGTHYASAQLCDVLLRSLALFANHRRSVAFNRSRWRFKSDYIWISMKFDTFMLGFKQTMHISDSLIDFQRSCT